PQPMKQVPLFLSQVSSHDPITPQNLIDKRLISEPGSLVENLRSPGQPVLFKWLEEYKSREDILISETTSNKRKIIKRVFTQRRTLEVKSQIRISRDGEGCVPSPLLDSGEGSSLVGGVRQKSHGIEHYIRDLPRVYFHQVSTGTVISLVPTG